MTKPQSATRRLFVVGIAAIACSIGPALYADSEDPGMQAVLKACGRDPAPNQTAAEWGKCVIETRKKFEESYKASGPHSRVVPQSELGIHEFADTAWAKGAFYSWEGYLNGKLYRILAGEDVNQPTTGLIIVDWGGTHGPEFYRIPNSGDLTIVSTHDGSLNLSSKSGKKYRFDISNREVTQQ